MLYDERQFGNPVIMPKKKIFFLGITSGLGKWERFGMKSKRHVMLDDVLHIGWKCLEAMLDDVLHIGWKCLIVTNDKSDIPTECPNDKL